MKYCSLTISSSTNFTFATVGMPPLSIKKEKLLLTIHISTAESISVGGMVDGSSTKLQRFLNRQIVAVSGVHHSISVSGTGTDSKHVSIQTLTVAVDVIQAWSTFIPPAYHCTLKKQCREQTELAIFIRYFHNT